MAKDFGSAVGAAAAGDLAAYAHPNGLPKAHPGKFALVGSGPPAAGGGGVGVGGVGGTGTGAGPAASMDSGSNGSPSRGSGDVAMTTPNGRNGAPAAPRLHHMDSGLGDDPDSPDVIGSEFLPAHPLHSPRWDLACSTPPPSHSPPSSSSLCRQLVRDQELELSC